MDSIPLEGMVLDRTVWNTRSMSSTRTKGITPFGSLLKHWRASSGMSQLALSAAAQTTSRHVSFLETGRSRPTAQMVIRLCDALNVPLRERNRLLEAAGLAAIYGQEAFEEPRYERARAAVAQLLEAHEPYPAILVEKDGDVVSANKGAAVLFGEDLTGGNLMQWMFSGGDPAQKIANWSEIAAMMLPSLRLDAARDPEDPMTQAALQMVEQAATIASPGPQSDQLVVCPWFNIDGKVIKTMIIAARFDNVVDVTLDELRIELVYPLDDEAEAFFRSG